MEGIKNSKSSIDLESFSKILRKEELNVTVSDWPLTLQNNHSLPHTGSDNSFDI